MPFLAELLQKSFDRLNKGIDNCDNILMFRDLWCEVYFALLNEPFWLKRHKLVPSLHCACICHVAFVFPLLCCFFHWERVKCCRGVQKGCGISVDLHPWRQSQLGWTRSWTFCDTKLVSLNLLWAGLFRLETSRCPFQRKLFFEAATLQSCATSAAVISDGIYPAKGGCCACTGGRAHANQNQERWQWSCSRSGLFRWLCIYTCCSYSPHASCIKVCASRCDLVKRFFITLMRLCCI